MSPITQAPQRGYSDWQRTENWDTPTLFSQTHYNAANSFTTPVLDVSRFGYLGGVDTAFTNDIIVTATWYADAAATVQLTQRKWLLSASISGIQYRLINAGPFVTIKWQRVTGGNLDHSAVLFATNRVYASEQIPDSSMQITANGIVVTTTTVTVLWPAYAAAGPASFYYSSSVTGTLFEIVGYPAAGGQYPIASATTTASVTNGVVPVVLPIGAWSANVLNPGPGNASCNVTVTASPTGST